MLLSSNHRWTSNSTDFIQIIHCSQNHWVCVSNLLTPLGVVEVYDSLPATDSNTLTRQIAAIVQSSSPKFTVCWINVQHQSGGDDCALFAIAFVEALCAGKDPHVLSFDQSQMRHHLQLCLEQGAISSFPEAAKPNRVYRTRMKTSRNVYVYCKCRLPWDRLGKMVQCSKCSKWYHQACLCIPDIVF